MKLKDYVSKYKGQIEAAKRLGISQGYLSELINKEGDFTPDVSYSLVERSNNELTLEDLMPVRMNRITELMGE